MASCSRISKFFRKSEIDNEHFRGIVPSPHEEIVGFDVTVNETFCVNCFNALNHLIGKMKDGFKGELAMGVIEQVF